MPKRMGGRPGLRGQVNPLSPVPLHRQIYLLIRREIEEGNWQPDDIVPSQHEITEFYGVARGTVTRAVESLKHDGFVYTVAGKGVFVSAPESWPGDFAGS